MKAAAVIANVYLIGVVVYMFAENGPPNDDELFFVLGMIVAPVLSIWALAQVPSVPSSAEESTAGLARRALRAKLKKAAEEEH